jgi:hypothetical protein
MKKPSANALRRQRCQENRLKLRQRLFLASSLIVAAFSLYSLQNRLANSGYGLCRLPYSELKTAYRELAEKKPSELEKKILKLVKDTPMEAMVSEISKRDQAVAAFILGIGMKESKYGLYSPKKDGRECYNYWGYRGKENTTKSGYSCFDSPEHAIQVVGDRIERIVRQGAKTPAQMISWKCGSTCAGHSPESVQKWIDDVAINYYKLNPGREVAKSR